MATLRSCFAYLALHPGSQRHVGRSDPLAPNTRAWMTRTRPRRRGQPLRAPLPDARVGPFARGHDPRAGGMEALGHGLSATHTARSAYVVAQHPHKKRPAILRCDGQLVDRVRIRAAAGSVLDPRSAATAEEDTDNDLARSLSASMSTSGVFPSASSQGRRRGSAEQQGQGGHGSGGKEAAEGAHQAQAHHAAARPSCEHW